MVSKAMLSMLSVSHAFDDLYQGAVPALVALLVVERHYSYTGASGILLAATFLSSLLQPVFGVLSDRRQMDWIIPVGLGAAGVGIGFAGVVHGYLLTWIAVAVSGLGVAAYHPQASRRARLAAAGTAAGMSVFALGGNIGFAIGPTLTTVVLLATGLGGTPLLAIPALMMASVLALVLHGGWSRSLRPPMAAWETRPSQPNNWTAFGWLTGAVILRSIMFAALSALLALYLHSQFGASPTAGSSALTVVLGVGAMATLLGGRLADQFGRVVVLRIGYAIAIPGFVLLLFTASLPVAFVAVVILGVGLYLPFSVQVTLGQDYLPTEIGTASGVTLGLAVSAGGLVAPLLGLIADHAGIRSSLALAAVLPIAVLMITIRLPETREVKVPQAS